ncbi:hypothetical protein BKA63DRAFT_18219 [Paraphoma chrysanthemicola]|nr:hypothetical protein BKA63DRAFT_18219 [Paraphoma chrysanthemicola]
MCVSLLWLQSPILLVSMEIVRLVVWLGGERWLDQTTRRLATIAATSWAPATNHRLASPLHPCFGGFASRSRAVFLH